MTHIVGSHPSNSQCTMCGSRGGRIYRAHMTHSTVRRSSSELFSYRASYSCTRLLFLQPGMIAPHLIAAIGSCYVGYCIYCKLVRYKRHVPSAIDVHRALHVESTHCRNIYSFVTQFALPRMLSMIVHTVCPYRFHLHSRRPLLARSVQRWVVA